MNKKQQKLLAAVLARVAQDGWTDVALKRGAKAARLSAAEARGLFPNGIADVVASFHASIDAAMHDAIKGSRKFVTLRVRDKVAFCVRARLQALAPNRDVLRRLLVWALLPRNIPNAAIQLWQVADIIWIAAGDASTDYNYYTKRVLLIGVMKATLAFWLDDTSPGNHETWVFLDRRIDDVMRLGKGIGIVKSIGVADIAAFVRARLAL